MKSFFMTSGLMNHMLRRQSGTIPKTYKKKINTLYSIKTNMPDDQPDDTASTIFRNISESQTRTNKSKLKTRHKSHFLNMLFAMSLTSKYTNVE